MNKVKVAVVGYGHLGKWHTQKAAQLDNSELVAIVEPSTKGKENASENHPGIRVVNSLSEVMDEIDAAVIVTPTSTHFELTKELLENNKHVFCEKPLCSSIEEANSLENYLGESIVQVGHSERCHQVWETLIPEINKIKGKKTIKIDRFASFKGRATDVDVVSDLMIHDIDLMLYLFNANPISVHSIGHKIRTNKWDHVTSHFILENGDEVFITSGRNHVHEVRSLEVMSENGCHYVDLFRNKFVYGTNEMFEDESFVRESSYEKRDHLLLEQERFYDSILNKKPAMVTFDEGRNAVRIVSKVLESLDSNETLKL